MRITPELELKIAEAASMYGRDHGVLTLLCFDLADPRGVVTYCEHKISILAKLREREFRERLAVIEKRFRVQA